MPHRAFRPSVPPILRRFPLCAIVTGLAATLVVAAALIGGVCAAQIKPNPGGQKPPPAGAVRLGLGALRTDRLAVRGGNDHEAADVGKRVVETTIDKLLALPRP